jgi:hypothetical protein
VAALDKRAMTKTQWIYIGGTLSLLPSAYLWACGLAHTFGVACKGNPLLVLLCVLFSIPVSALCGRRGSSLWYVVTGIATGTLLFAGFSLH